MLPLVLVACDQQPVAPIQSSGTHFAATRSEVTNTIDFVNDTSDCTANPRIGELLLFTGRIAFAVSTTTSGSGNVNVTWTAAYDPKVHLVGQTSGTVWTIDAARTHSTLHDNLHGLGESFEGIATEYYTNAGGAQLRLQGNTHLTVTGQGTIVLDRPLVWACFGG
jgi:hypothetical protein